MIRKLYYWLSYRRYSLFHNYGYDFVAETVCKEFIKKYNSGIPILINKYEMILDGTSVWVENRWYSFASRGGMAEGFGYLWDNSRPSFETLIMLIEIYKKEAKIQYSTKQQERMRKAKTYLS